MSSEKKSKSKKSDSRDSTKSQAKKVKEPESFDDSEEDVFFNILEERLLAYLKAELDKIDPKAYDRVWEKLSNELKLAVTPPVDDSEKKDS